MQSCTAHFEGPEKKLEIILFSRQEGVRSSANGCWEKVVRSCRADIVSRMANEMMDAYLLSESSLFVWEDRVVMITCGQTNLINAVPSIVDIVGRENVAMVFYERKNQMFPDRQQTDFEADMAEMGKYFQGKRYRLGPANHDHVQLFYSSHGKVPPGNDATLQVLMHELSPSAMEMFSREKAGSAVQAAVLYRLTGLYDGMKADSHFFSPFGYSLNGICRDLYYTVHVTPQREGSYASLETNVTADGYRGVIKEMVSVFKPGRFSVLMTASMDPDNQCFHKSAAAEIPGYSVTEKSGYEFDCGYAATFLTHKRDA